MKVGTAQVNIAPKPGIDLAGFAQRPQPSTGIADALWVRALYLENGIDRLLWLHADLLAFDQALADTLRSQLAEKYSLRVSQVIVSASHTHSAPAAIQLTGCGQVDLNYVNWLKEQCRDAAKIAVQQPETCRLVTTESQCELGIDRRGFASAHTDPRVGIIGWCRADGTFKAIFLDYAMHPVCLKDNQFSADWPGEAARILHESLPGAPVTFVFPGACGNINPPSVGVSHGQMAEWGRKVAESAGPALLAARSVTPGQAETLKVVTETISLPVDFWNVDQIEKQAAFCLAQKSGFHEFGDSYGVAVETWRRTMINGLHQGRLSPARAELGLVWFGKVALVTINAEIFSVFTGLAASQAKCPVYTISCANGMIGYVPSADAYDEGAYEVLWSMLFYNLPRVAKYGLESLAERAHRLIQSCEP